MGRPCKLFSKKIKVTFIQHKLFVCVSHNPRIPGINKISLQTTAENMGLERELLRQLPCFSLASNAILFPLQTRSTAPSSMCMQLGTWPQKQQSQPLIYKTFQPQAPTVATAVSVSIRENISPCICGQNNCRLWG